MKSKCKKISNYITLIVTGYYGVWFVFSLGYYLMLVFGLQDGAFFDAMGVISFYGFLVPNLSGIVSIVTIISLLVFSGVCALREKDMKCYFNKRLLGLILLIVITVLLQAYVNLYLF